MAARAMNQSLEILKPLLAGSSLAPAGRVCIGTVQGASTILVRTW